MIISWIGATTWQFAGSGAHSINGKLVSLFAQEGHGDDDIRTRIVEIYDELRPSLYRNLIALGLNVDAADDVIQETFLALVRQFTEGRKIEDLRGWVFRTAHNLSLNTQRQQRKIRLQGTEAEVYARQLPATGLNPEQEYLLEEQMQRYEIAIERLTTQQRQCLLLRKEGLLYREIAMALDVGPSRVPQLLKRAVDRLMEELYGYRLSPSRSV